jgi:hypothetical protein
MEELTAMDDIVPMAILQRTPYLPSKLSRHAFPQPSMADDKVQHLPSVDVLEHHVVVMLMDDHLTHTADIGMVKEQREGCFAECADLFRGILGSLPRGGLRVRAIQLRSGRWMDAREDLDSELHDGQHPASR